MTRKLNVVLLVILLFAGIPFYWLLLDTTTNGAATKPVTIGQLRTLAEEMPGEGPIEVRYEQVARRAVSSNLLAAGSGLRPVTYAIRAYQLVYRDGTWLTIDRGISRKSAQRERVRNFDPAAQSAVDRALAGAKMRLVHANRSHHDEPYTSKADLRPQIVRSADSGRTAPFAVAPGVILIPADSVEPGESMVYVRAEDRRELLFAGDIAPIGDSWIGLRPPARAAMSLMARRNRDEIVAWLRTIRALKAAAPGLQIVTGHGANLPEQLSRHFAFPDPHHDQKRLQATGIARHDRIERPSIRRQRRPRSGSIS